MSFDAVKIEEIIAAHVRSRAAMSLIRLGDGEAMLMRDMRFFPPQARLQILQTWFGRFDFPVEEIDELCTKLKVAAYNASILGIPGNGGGYLMRSSSLALSKTLTPLNDSTVLTILGIHEQLYHSGALSRLLKGQRWCGLIGSRDITKHVKDVWGIRDCLWHKVPTEQYYSSAKDTSHFPVRYRELLEEIEVPFQGAVYLVGAGVCGKVYCDRVRELGGIALDIGSIFDLLTGKRTRHSHRNVDVLSVAAYEGTPDELADAALAAFQSGDLEEAERFAREAGRVGPSIYVLAMVAHRREDLTLALSLIDEAIRINPEAVRYRVLRGRILMDSRRLVDAEETLREARSIRFVDTECLIYLSQICDAFGRSQEAIGLAAEALSYSPEGAFARVNMHRLLAKAGTGV